MRERSSFVVSALVLAVLTGCGHPLASVNNTTPRYAPAIVASNDVREAEQHILAAGKLQSRDSLGAIGEYLRAADLALTRLRQQPGDADAVRDYDFALSRAFSTIRHGHIDAWSKPLAVPGYVITYRKDTRVLWNPAEYEFIPCDELTVGGTAFTERARRKGLGAPLLGIRQAPVKDFQKRFLRTAHVYYSVTATAAFAGNRCEISFDDPLARETVTVAGRNFALAGDFSTSVAMFLVREQPQKLGLTRLFHPDNYKDTTLLYRLQPYDSRKIPVLFVHGLQDTSATWMPMLNALLDDPQIRNNYQFWFFTYPSGYPFPYSAALLRHDLDLFDKAYPDHKPITIVGHSMGGLLTRLMLTDSGDEMWRYLFNLAPAETPLSPEDKELLSSVLIFKHRRDINRAIFLSTPHRGSDLASNWIGKIATRLVHLPATLVKAGQDMTTVASETRGGFHLRRMPNSIDTLSPTSSLVVSMNKCALASGIPYHQIIGDRGKGDSPNSSDGVVAYWSSHLDGATSTRIVPSGHPTHQNVEGIEEVRRILKLRLRGQPARSTSPAPELADVSAEY
jgi:pimeloyl-ACP methyl ester carboxylesterase